MKVGEVVEKLGIAASALRYYERIGLLQPVALARGYNNYRDYGDQDLETLKLVMTLKDSGFRLEDIGQLLHGNVGGCGPLQEAAERQLEAIQSTIDLLNAKKRALQELLFSCQSECSPLSKLDCVR